ncbi:response regulator transcription factor (plasmid) [Streptomyces sp. HUAS 31]|uniref:response regulator n=1 Tax=Streptomyces sp. HUAS 31 TaxID=3020055 RepID=UPI00230561A8|nr:response regulator transcription factor [Streptomyces sp. HUAS 31]WCE02499.1 response regulator transcription factor [Streptomyces sp. HUAS 31]
MTSAVSGAPVRLLLVDDHTVVRAGLRALLGGEPGFEVVGETGDASDGVRLAERLRPDVVLMDLRLPGGAGPASDGVDATRRLLAAVPGTRVVMFTGYGSQSDVRRAVEAGATGYVLKAGPPAELLRAVRIAAAGGMGLAPEAAKHLVGHLMRPEPAFTGREIEVVRLLAHGLSNRGIADALFLAEATVKSHLIRIYRKLGSSNRASTVKEAIRLGLVEVDTLP